MSRIIKSISLDFETNEIAKQHGNLSAFVRTCLMRYHYQQTARKNEPCSKIQGSGYLNLGRCNPMNKKGLHCFKCWPNGRPSKEGFEQVLLMQPTTDLNQQQALFLHASDDEKLKALDEITAEENKHVIEVTGKVIKPTKTIEKKQVGLIRRFWRYIY